MADEREKKKRRKLQEFRFTFNSEKWNEKVKEKKFLN